MRLGEDGSRASDQIRSHGGHITRAARVPLDVENAQQLVGLLAHRIPRTEARGLALREEGAILPVEESWFIWRSD